VRTLECTTAASGEELQTESSEELDLDDDAEEVEDGEGHQAAGRVAAMTGGETKQNPSQVVSRGFSVGLA